jgi:chromosome segregation ATPase
MAKKKSRKKAAPAKKAKKAPAPKKPKGDLAGEAAALKQAAADVLEARNAEMLKLLGETTEIVGATSFTEVQIQRQKDLIAELRDRKKAVDAEAGALKKEHDGWAKDVQAADKEKTKLASENKTFEKRHAALSRETTKLQDRREKLKKEVDGLERSSERLRQDVERLEMIRKEYLDRIAKFREMREDLIR